MSKDISQILIILFAGTLLFGAEPNTPSLSLSSENEKEGVTVTANLRDSKGNPVPDAPIYFSILTSFGPLKLKSLPTDEDGSASLLISGSDRKGDFTVEANFKGNEQLSPVFAKTNISFSEYKQNGTSFLRLPLPFFISFSQLMDILIPRSSEIFVSTESRGLISTDVPSGTGTTPYPSVELISILFIIFASIWSIYFYVMKQIWRIKSDF